MRKNGRKWIQVIILIIVLLIGTLTIGLAIWSKEDPVKEGYSARDFALIGLDGKSYNLSDFRGKVVIINFWGTFCPPCVREMPALQKQYEKWKSKDVVVLGINLNESRVTVKSFIERYQITFPILLDNDRVRKAYMVKSYPTTFYIDSNGKINDIFVGEMTEDDIATRIAKLSKPTDDAS